MSQEAGKVPGLPKHDENGDNGSGKITNPNLEVHVPPKFEEGRSCYRLWRIESRRLWQLFAVLKIPR